MSDEDQDIDIESDDDDASSSAGGSQYMSEADKKAHHNALERKRRDHIKESFSSLRDAVPSLKRDKSGKPSTTSRAQILKQATEYIEYMTKRNGSIQKDIDSMKKQNQFLKQKVQSVERGKLTTGAFDALSKVDLDEMDSSDSSEPESSEHCIKKPKIVDQ